MPTPIVSFILATHNRRDVLANTLARILDCGLNRDDFEIIVVDNASTDGSVDVARAGADTVLDLKENQGSCAKTFGVGVAHGQFVVFLDDDSFPRPGSMERMIRHFGQQSSLAAAGFVVFLPNGEREGGALPDVFVGCGVGFRATALREVGSLDISMFMQAEEYDLAFRLVRTGWDVRVFGDLAVDHLKTPHARRTARTTYYDTRNNLRVINRYLPRDARRICREDCIQRYQWLAERDNHHDSFARGIRDGFRTPWLERMRDRRWHFDANTFEKLFRWNEIAARLRSLKDRGTHRILLADFGKNIYPFVDAARRAEIEIVAVVDDRFASPNRTYRGIPIIPVASALATKMDDARNRQGRDREGATVATPLPYGRGPETSYSPIRDYDRIVISSTAPVHATRTFNRLRELTNAPIDLWYPETIDRDLWPADSTPARQMSDEILVERSALRAPCASRGTSEPGAQATGSFAKSEPLARETVLTQR